MDKIIIELKSVTIGYPGHIVLKEVNLPIYRNDFLGIIGPNGAGKTSLLKTIMGLLKPIKGTIKYYGVSSGNKPSIGYLPQHTTFNKHFPIKVLDIVLSGLASPATLWKSFGVKEKHKAFEILELLSISQLANRTVSELSGGELQRIMLARALISSPELLILDEPETYTDIEFSVKFHQLLRQINEKIGIIIVSHDIGTILAHVKNIACVFKTVHYHSKNEISEDILNVYSCPLELIFHGQQPHKSNSKKLHTSTLPHRVLKTHPDKSSSGKDEAND